jgi:hypothetical protein
MGRVITVCFDTLEKISFLQFKELANEKREFIPMHSRMIALIREFMRHFLNSAERANNGQTWAPAGGGARGHLPPLENQKKMKYRASIPHLPPCPPNLPAPGKIPAGK